MNPTLCEMLEEKHRHTQSTINEYNITTANGVNMFGLLAYGNILIITHQAVVYGKAKLSNKHQAAECLTCS
jgi:hypothetical protein